MAMVPYLELVVGFALLTYALETLLDLRQYAVLLRTDMSAPLKEIVSEEKFLKARKYGIDKMQFKFLHSAFSTFMELAILVAYVMPWIWNGVERLFPDWTRGGEIVHTILFLSVIHLWSQIVELPFSLYSTFFVEAKHGFNTQTISGFFRDLLIQNLLAAVLVPPIVTAVILVIQVGGTIWQLAFKLWLLVFCVSVFMMAIYPVLIAPLFNKFTPLPEGPLRTKIEQLAASLKFPLTKLFVVDGSTRSAHSNAYMYGFFKSKRIVLYDTLLNQCKDADDQVVAVIAHELGHWKLWHTVTSFSASQVLIFAHFAIFAFTGNNSDLFLSFGFSDKPTFIGLLLVQHLMAPIGPLMSCSLNALSRAFEFQADAFAVSLGFGEPLKAGLIKMQEENLGTMATDPWYSTYHYTHPPLVERLSALDLANKKNS